MVEQIPIHEPLKHKKAILCMLKTNVHDHTIYKIRMNELESLVETLGIDVVHKVVQSRFKPFAKYHIGSGKVKQVRSKVKKLDVDLVIFYNLLKSSQKLNLMQALNCEVIDRYELTLEIFDRMAADTLSKLQIQAARIEKLAPFIKLQASINYRHDRPFFRSGGEYGFHGKLTELTRNQARIREEIDKLMDDKIKRINNRKELGFPVICIAGFYNAGKTSLFNALTGDSKPVSNRPFTTLSSKYQKRFIDYETTVLFIDTIGFVLDLDPRLIQSFKLNILDIKSSDLVILLLEITDPVLTLKMKLNEGIKLLKEIGVTHERIVVVFNKLDLAPQLEGKIGDLLELERFNVPWISVSAKERENLQKMLNLISKRLAMLEDKTMGYEEMSDFEALRTTLNRLLEQYPSDYNPDRNDPFENLVGTILSQNTNRKNQITAYTRLKKAVGLTPEAINKADINDIKEAIRPAGMYNQRSSVLKSVSQEIIDNYDGEVDSIFDDTYLVAKEKLMAFPGVGPKTADVVLMFNGKHTVIPVDRHIERISKRLEVVPENADYEEIRTTLQDASTPELFKDVHLSMIKFGRDICKAQNPKCLECLLNDICPYPEKINK
jgi:GTP-binding protein HflX